MAWSSPHRRSSPESEHRLVFRSRWLIRLRMRQLKRRLKHWNSLGEATAAPVFDTRFVNSTARDDQAAGRSDAGVLLREANNRLSGTEVKKTPRSYRSRSPYVSVRSPEGIDHFDYYGRNILPEDEEGFNTSDTDHLRGHGMDSKRSQEPPNMAHSRKGDRPSVARSIGTG